MNVIIKNRLRELLLNVGFKCGETWFINVINKNQLRDQGK